MKSKTSGEEVSDTTYIAEMVMIRKYARQRKNLPAKFWNLPEYKEEFQKQKIEAIKLNKVFSMKIIMTVLNREQWIFSLYLKKLATLLKLEERKQEKIKKIVNGEPEKTPHKKRERNKKSVDNDDIFKSLDS